MQKMFGPCEAKNGTEINELLEAGVGRHQRVRQSVKTDSRGTIEKNHENRVSEACEQV